MQLKMIKALLTKGHDSSERLRCCLLCANKRHFSSFFETGEDPRKTAWKGGGAAEEKEEMKEKKKVYTPMLFVPMRL